MSSCRDQQRISPTIPYHAAFLCPGDVLTDIPASSLAGQYSKWPVLSSSPQGEHHKLETTMEMSHGKPLSYTRNHSHAITEHYPGCSSRHHSSTLLRLPTRISIAWLVVHQCSSPLCKATLVYPNSNPKQLLSFTSPGPATRQHLGKCSWGRRCLSYSCRIQWQAQATKLDLKINILFMALQLTKTCFCSGRWQWGGWHELSSGLPSQVYGYRHGQIHLIIHKSYMYI